ncbi:MAG TPA: DUF2089 family protein [Tepidisphaeraceae bacterium]|jgi:hypothetical protein|nr:DUF2089 family protein [Tepidisphaeraceae bacterium]
MKPAWLEWLSDEDLAFMKRFILASGSLKDLASAYGISYPTVRLRLDRLIEKIKVFESHQITSDFERTLRGMFADGAIDAATMKSLLSAHQKELEKNHDPQTPSRGDAPRAVDSRGHEG